MPAWTARLQQSQASDAPLPHFSKLTFADCERQEETARAQVDSRPELRPGAHLRAGLASLAEMVSGGRRRGSFLLVAGEGGRQSKADEQNAADIALSTSR